MRIAIIPARGGSKRIPRKNILPFVGLPIIAHSIAAAIAAQSIDRVIVSTDDEEIANVARAYGAEVPFMRPDALADDHATTLDVVAHAFEWAGSEVDALLSLYATAPLVHPRDIDEAYETFELENSAYVFSATEFSFPVQRGFTLNATKPVMLFPEHAPTRSQDLPTVYHDAGQFYWCRRDAVLAGLPIFAPHSRAHLLPRERVQDIDTPEDWVLAERLFALMQDENQ